MSLTDRAGGVCELCSNAEQIAPFSVAPHEDDNPDHQILACSVCLEAMESPNDHADHWRCLQGSAWSAEPPVQVVAWRLLHRLEPAWARELAEQIYLDEDTVAWARQGQPDPDAEATVDSNGTALSDGDTVTLIKDLNVKGGGFTAKRGTTVKNIRLSGDPKYVEGRINKQTIVLVAAYLKKA